MRISRRPGRCCGIVIIHRIVDRARWEMGHDLPLEYADLVAHFPPRPIHDAVDYDNTTEIVMAMAGHTLNQDQADYLKVLSEMILQYNHEHDAPRKRGTVRQR